MGLAHQLQRVRAAAGGHHVQREAAVSVHPGRAIGVDVDQVARRQAEHVGVTFDGPRGRSTRRHRRRGWRHRPGRPPTRAGRPPARRATTSCIVCSASPRKQASAPAARYTSGWSVTSAPVDRPRGSRRARAMPIIVMAASRMRVQAHLREEVEVVLEQHDDLGPVVIETGLERRTRRRRASHRTPRRRRRRCAARWPRAACSAAGRASSSRAASDRAAGSTSARATPWPSGYRFPLLIAVSRPPYDRGIGIDQLVGNPPPCEERTCCEHDRFTTHRRTGRKTHRRMVGVAGREAWRRDRRRSLGAAGMDVTAGTHPQVNASMSEYPEPS